MQRAGAATASIIADSYPELLDRGVLIFAGPGNNGGDGWVIAQCLAASGIKVVVTSPEESRSADCIAERTAAEPLVEIRDFNPESVYRGEGIVIDALLGTGSRGDPEGALRSAITALAAIHAVRVAVDIPSGLSETSFRCPRADLTVSYGNVKRRHLARRGDCGRIVIVDIGLLPVETGAPVVDALWVREMLPPIDADAHKGTRGKVLVEGGAAGMTGAAILAARAALRTGAGMVKVRADARSLDIITAALAEALTEDSTASRTKWADVAVIGPGFGRDDSAINRVEAAIRAAAGPIVLDADALSVFEGARARLHDALAGRDALLTPHVVEASRLAGVSPATVEDQRFEIGSRLAKDLGAVVLLKGVPTVISAPDGRMFVVPAGTPALATAGSGDVLSGIAGALLCQMRDVTTAAACAAWIHGRAAELAGPFIRGSTLEEVLDLLPNALRIPAERPRYPIVAELPPVPMS